MSNEFKQGLLRLHTRQFGSVVETVVKLLADYQSSGQLDFDLIDAESGKRIEVKSSRVQKKSRLPKDDPGKIYDFIMDNSSRRRFLRQDQAAKVDFDCNIQQVKTDLFDVMYYLLFFYDVIEVFQIEKGEILSDTNLNYSNKQHRGNEGEGQFHINTKNYQYHKDSYYQGSITYEDLIEVLRKGKRGLG